MNDNLDKSFRYYHPGSTNHPVIAKEDAVQVTREELISLFKTYLCDKKQGGGVFIILDKIGNEILFLYDTPPEDEKEPCFTIEIPFFYGRETNVSFIETVRAWGPKPIRVHWGEGKLSGLEDIINNLPTVFHAECIPDLSLHRSLYYMD